MLRVRSEVTSLGHILDEINKERPPRDLTGGLERTLIRIGLSLIRLLIKNHGNI